MRPDRPRRSGWSLHAPQSRPFTLPEEGRQSVARPGYARHHRAQRHADNGSDLRIGQALDRYEEQHRSLLLGQRIKGAQQVARRDIASAGEDWQRLAGAVRPHLPALWTAASADERLRFIRHLRPYWELGLHRAAPESNAWLQDARRAGRFRHHAGRVLRLSSAAGGRVAVSWRARGESRPQTLLVDRVFNTRGFEFDWTRIDDALLRNLLGKGLAVPHETGFGIAADPATGEVAQRHGQRPGLYAVGHPLRGVSWESNAIGEQIAGATATVTALAEQLRSAAETGFFPSAGTGLGRQAVRAA